MAPNPTQVTEGTAPGLTYWRRPGSGPVLVCLHGIGSNAGSFRPLLAHLPPDWDVIAWNAPGYGGSAPLGVDWPVEADYAEALRRFLSTLQVRPEILFGHSLGTLMAARFAADHPGQVGHLVLGACATGHGVAQYGTLSDAAAARISELQDMGARAFAESRAPRLLGDPNAPEARRAVVDAMAAVTLPGYAQAVRMLASGRLVASLHQVTDPVHILWGTEDVVTPLPQSQAAAKAAQTQITEIPGAGHALHVEAPKPISTALIACLAGTGPSASELKKEHVQ